MIIQQLLGVETGVMKPREPRDAMDTESKALKTLLFSNQKVKNKVAEYIGPLCVYKGKVFYSYSYFSLNISVNGKL